jgi:hypothetical protein
MCYPTKEEMTATYIEFSREEKSIDRELSPPSREP